MPSTIVNGGVSHMYRVFKVSQALLNGLALLVVAVGMIAGSIFENTIVMSCLATWGSVIKGWNDFKKFPIKGHVPICLHHVRQDFDRIEKSRTRHSV